MNNPDDLPIDVEEMRQWVLAEKERCQYSWPTLAALIGTPTGTLSPWATGTYPGRAEPIARRVFRYKQLVESQRERAIGVPQAPGYFETATSRSIHNLLAWAQMGRITVCATGPGTGKTMTVKHYQGLVSNVWLATMKPTTRTLTAMIFEVLTAVGSTAKGGWGRQLSHQVESMVAQRRGLLCIDEANHLEYEAFEEIRSWHDATGVGICLLGNEELTARIRSGHKRDQFARLNSRIAHSLTQPLPRPEDVDAFHDAWQITDPAMQRMLAQIALAPGAGGLREIRQIVEAGSMLAEEDGQPLGLTHLREAQATRATRYIRA